MLEKYLKEFAQHVKMIETKMSAMEQLRNIVDSKTAGQVRYPSGGVMIDTFSASAMVKVYDALNEENKAKVDELIQTKQGLIKYQKIAFQLLESKEQAKQKLDEARPTQLMELAKNLKYMPGVEKMISLNYVADGISAFVRTTDGNAYEFEIRPATYAKGHQHKRGLEEEFSRAFNKEPKTLDDVIDKSVGGYEDDPETYFVHHPEGGDSGEFYSYEEAYEEAKKLWPDLPE